MKLNKCIQEVLNSGNIYKIMDMNLIGSLKQAEVSGSSEYIYLMLLACCDKDGYCSTTDDRLAEAANKHKKTVATSKNELVKKGLISIEKQGKRSFNLVGNELIITGEGTRYKVTCVVRKYLELPVEKESNDGIDVGVDQESIFQQGSLCVEKENRLNTYNTYNTSNTTNIPNTEVLGIYKDKEKKEEIKEERKESKVKMFGYVNCQTISDILTIEEYEERTLTLARYFKFLVDSNTKSNFIITDKANLTLLAIFNGDNNVESLSIKLNDYVEKCINAIISSKLLDDSKSHVVADEPTPVVPQQRVSVKSNSSSINSIISLFKAVGRDSYDREFHKFCKIIYKECTNDRQEDVIAQEIYNSAKNITELKTIICEIIERGTL